MLSSVLLKLNMGLSMKRSSASFAVGLVLLTVIACTPSTPSSETASPSKPIASSVSASPSKPIATNTSSWYEYSSEA